MDPTLLATIINILETTNDLTLATVRQDGYPQATTVSYASDGLKIYFGTGAQAQKAQNLARCDRVSATINRPYASWDEIQGLSIGGTVQIVTDPSELGRVGQLMLTKFPQVMNFAPPDASGMAIFRLTPQVISVLDYTKGFGHTDLVRVEGTSDAPVLAAA